MTSAKNRTSKGKRLIIVHIGPREGFEMMVYFALNLKIIVTSDYHHEMNGDNFYEMV